MKISPLHFRRRPSSTRRLPSRWASLALLMLVLMLGAAACQPAITVLQPMATASPLPAATVVPAARGLSVISVDFDPPLDSAEFLESGGISLLVAVANNGRHTESRVEVTAELLDPSGRARPVELMTETVSVPTLTPGAVEVVRFSEVTNLPIRSSYKLVVRVAPAPGETDLGDNTRAYDILVDGTR